LGTLVDLARKLRPYIEKAAMSLNDEDALEAVQLFPKWETDTSYEVDTKVQYENILYKCIQAHTSQEGWAPNVAASLWAKVLIPDENIIPDWEQPNSTNAYQIGDKVMHNDKIWENTIANNVWEPGVYGWIEIQ